MDESENRESAASPSLTTLLIMGESENHESAALDQISSDLGFLSAQLDSCESHPNNNLFLNEGARTTQYRTLLEENNRLQRELSDVTLMLTMANATMEWKKVRQIWNKIPRTERSIDNRLNVSDALKTVDRSFTKYFGKPTNELGLPILVTWAMVQLFQAKMLNQRKGVYLMEQLRICQMCLRPFAVLKTCPFCKLMKGIPEMIAAATHTDTVTCPKLQARVELVLWSTRRPDLMDERARKDTVNKVLECVQRHCCEVLLLPQGLDLKETVIHTRSLEKQKKIDFVTKWAAHCFRWAMIMTKAPLSCNNSVLYDYCLEISKGQMFCALCRVESRTLKSHIISNCLLKLCGNETSSHILKIRDWLEGGFTEPKIINTTSETVSLCCKDCEATFSRNGEDFLSPLTNCITNLNKGQNPKNVKFELNQYGQSPIFHAVVGIAFRQCAVRSVVAANAPNRDMLVVGSKRRELREITRLLMLCTNEKSQFEKAANMIAVLFVPQVDLTISLSPNITKPMYVVERCLGSDLCFIHLCLHDLHFLVMRRGDLQSVYDMLYVDSLHAPQEIKLDTTELGIDTNFPTNSLLDHDNELFQDAVRGFAYSMRKTRLRDTYGIVPSLESLIPEPTASLRLEGALVRLPKQLTFIVPVYLEPKSSHHPGRLVFSDRGGVCHMHRWHMQDIPVINTYLCVSGSTEQCIFVVFDVDLTERLGVSQDVSQLRPRLVYAVQIQNPRIQNLENQQGVRFQSQLMAPEIVWDISPYSKHDHEDLFLWDEGKYADLVTELPARGIQLLFNHTMFRARLFQQEFTAEKYTLLPLKFMSDDNQKKLKQLCSMAEREKVISQEKGTEAIKADAMLFNQPGTFW
eukprot:m.257437 g.257437  ORF g.257437 m.257437 type:complete len:860 (-) comp35307_c0_seq1:49-2628(-)